MKKIFIIIIILFIFEGNLFSKNATIKKILSCDVKVEKDFVITVDGRKVTTDVPPVEYEKIIYVPVRFVSEELKANIYWDKDKKEVKIVLKDKKVKLTIDKIEAFVNENEVKLLAPPFIYRGRTMIPLKFTASSLGAYVEENAKRMDIYISNSKNFNNKKNLKNKKEIFVRKKAKKHPKKIGWWRWTKSKIVSKVRYVFVKEFNLNISNKVVGIMAIVGWCLGIFLFFLQRERTSKKGLLNDRKVIAFLLFILTPFILWIARSTFWATMVPIGTSLVGLLSKEEWEDKLVTMSATAPAFGLIFTFLGLGQIIGPAIAAHNVDAIGYGISVKIEASVCGLTLWIFLNTVISMGSSREKKEEI